LDNEVQNLLAGIAQCKDCGNAACCLWIESLGLDGKTFEAVIQHGLAKTLLSSENPQPVSLCGRCTVKRISASLRKDDLSYLEVCSPHGTDEGMVMPMGY
jgi:hypothetical protein